MYPFNKATKILAVSYKPMDANGDRDSVIRYSNGKTDTIFSSGLHVNKGVLNYLSLKEYKQLTPAQICSLTDIIYNYHYKGHPPHYADPGLNCFFPSNALIFFDKNGHIYDYLKICFHCYGFDSQSQTLSIGTDCNQKYEILRKFFIDAGVMYGTRDKW